MESCIKTPSMFEILPNNLHAFFLILIMISTVFDRLVKYFELEISQEEV